MIAVIIVIAVITQPARRSPDVAQAGAGRARPSAGGHPADRHARVGLGEPGDEPALPVRHGHPVGVQPEHGGRQRRLALALQLVGGRERLAPRQRGQHRVGPVHHQPAPAASTPTPAVPRSRLPRAARPAPARPPPGTRSPTSAAARRSWPRAPGTRRTCCRRPARTPKRRPAAGRRRSSTRPWRTTRTRAADDLAQAPAAGPRRARRAAGSCGRPARSTCRCGASRKSSADRLGGVSTMIRSQLPSAASWPSFSIAMYSCVPENDEEIVL